MKKTKLSLSIFVLALGLSSLGIAQAATTNTATQGITQSQTLPSLAPILKQTSPSLVTITVKGKNIDKAIAEQINSYMFNFSEQFDVLFNDNLPSTATILPSDFTTKGEGVIIDAKNGYILTYEGLVNNASSISVKLSNDDNETATVVGVDPKTGIAVLKLSSSKGLQALTFADSSKLEAGDYTLALQNNGQIGTTPKLGIISAINNTLLRQDGLTHLIITNATNGESSGFLIDTQGKLLGLLIPGVTLNNQLGIAIPSNTVNYITSQIIKYGHVQRGTLGVKGLSMNDSIAKAIGSKQTTGAFISQVTTDSAAAKAGIQAGDIIIGFNNQKIDNFQELQAATFNAPVGQPLKIEFIRANKNATENITLTDNSASQQSVLSKYFNGAKLANTPNDNGVEVTQIVKNSFASQLGLKKNDVITAINNTPIKNLKDFNAVKIDGAIAMKVTRGKQDVYLILQ